MTAQRTSACEITKALGGRWTGSSGTARCPVHDDRTPSLSITERDGKLLVKCFAGCDQAAVWDALRGKGLVGGNDHGRTSRRREVSMVRPSDRSADALEIWKASQPASLTPAAEYLVCRGITIPPPTSIRYHEASHALVAAVQQHNGAAVAGIQRVYLTTDSRGTWKHKRLSLGPVKGGAVRLTPAASLLQLTESIEDGLALLQMTGKATWAVPGAGFLQNFEPPPEVHEIVLAPDHDEAGLTAIAKTAAWLVELGLNVETMLPPVDGADWCDALEVWDERAAIIEEGDRINPDDAEIEAWRGLPR